MSGMIVCAALAGIAIPSLSTAGGVFFAFGGASGDIDFDSDVSAANNVVTDDDIAGEAWVGYRFDSQVQIEGGGRQGISIDTFLLGDSFTLTELRFMAGYVVELADRFNFVPELGVSHWDLDTTDLPSSFFGSVRGDIDDSGNDLIWRISGEWRVLTRMHLYASYSEARYDFGDLTGPSFGFKFQF